MSQVMVRAKNKVITQHCSAQCSVLQKCTCLLMKLPQRIYNLGLNRIGHMSFLTGQDRTPKFAGQVLPDRTESGLIFLTFYITSMGYQFSYDRVPGHKFGVKKY